jgi:hypothetical protein
LKEGKIKPPASHPHHILHMSLIIHVGATCWDGFVWLGIFVICTSATGGDPKAPRALAWW